MGRSLKSRLSKQTILLGILFLVFLSNYYLQALDISIAFTRNFLDDLLAMPIILGFSRAAMRIIYKKPTWELEFLMLVMTFVTVSVLFEVILPQYYKHLTGDIIDILCYGAGVIFYQLFLQEV